MPIPDRVDVRDPAIPARNPVVDVADKWAQSRSILWKNEVVRGPRSQREQFIYVRNRLAEMRPSSNRPYDHRVGLHVVTVDAEDAWLFELAFHAHTSGRNIYICHTFGSTLPGHWALHALLLPTYPKGSLIDVEHIDQDSLNNRRANLRYAPHGTNVSAGFERRRRETR